LSSRLLNPVPDDVPPLPYFSVIPVLAPDLSHNNYIDLELFHDHELPSNYGTVLH
jgi:hypothetical protein